MCLCLLSVVSLCSDGFPNLGLPVVRGSEDPASSGIHSDQREQRRHSRLQDVHAGRRPVPHDGR